MEQEVENTVVTFKGRDYYLRVADHALRANAEMQSRGKSYTSLVDERGQCCLLGAFGLTIEDQENRQKFTSYADPYNFEIQSRAYWVVESEDVVQEFAHWMVENHIEYWHHGILPRIFLLSDRRDQDEIHQILEGFERDMRRKAERCESNDG